MGRQLPADTRKKSPSPRGKCQAFPLRLRSQRQKATQPTFRDGQTCVRGALTTADPLVGMGSPGDGSGLLT